MLDSIGSYSTFRGVKLKFPTLLFTTRHCGYFVYHIGTRADFPCYHRLQIRRRRLNNSIQDEADLTTRQPDAN